MFSLTVRNLAPEPADAVRLLRQTGWAKDRPEEVIQASLRNSYCVTAYTSTGEAVGMARLISDYATYGYLCDVVVDEAYRGQGVAKAMMDFIMGQEFVRNLRRFSLITVDAHELYRRYGFEAMERSERYMEIVKLKA